MVLKHNVDLTNEVVFARLSLSQNAIEEETAHVVDCFDGFYGVDASNIMRSVPITQSRFLNLFYPNIKRGDCNFEITNRAPELILRAGGFQLSAFVQEYNGASTNVSSRDIANVHLKRYPAEMLGRVDQQPDLSGLARVVAAGGRGWRSHYDVSFDVIEMITQNLEDDLNLDR